MYPQNQVQNKPTAAYILSLLGGIIGLLVSLALLALGALAFAAWDGTYSAFYGYDFGYSVFGWGWTPYIAFGTWMLITSILIIVFARKLNANPLQHGKYGALILIFSIIGVGGLFGFIGGILALVYKPILVGATQQYAPQPQPVAYGPPPQQQSIQQPQAYNCPQCGTLVQPNVKFCPACGKQQY